MKKEQKKDVIVDSNNIFNMDMEKLIEKKVDYESNIYKPNLDKENVEEYRSVIKFIPWVDDYTKSRISKWTVWLHNPDTDEKRSVDCPSSIPGTTSILNKIFYTLDKSPKAEYKELAQMFSRKRRFYSLIQILQDKQHPELVGKIKIFDFGQKINAKIDNLMKPIKGDDDEAAEEPNNPFDVIDGRPFNLIVTRQNKFQNYDESKFLNKKLPFLIGQEKITEKTQANLEKIKKFLKDESPNLLECEFKPWDDDVKMFVLNMIKATIPQGNLYNQILDKNKSFFDGFEKSEYSKKEKSKKEDDEEDETESKPKNRKIELDEDEKEDDKNEDEDEKEDEDELDDMIKKMETENKKSPKKNSKNDDDYGFLD